MDLQALYQSYIYFVLWAFFAMFIALAVLLRSNLTSPFRKISRKSWLILMAVFLAGLVIRVWVFPHQHLMYIDEPWYMETAKNLIQKHQPVICEYVDYGVESCQLTPKLPVWPFLLSIAFQIFGISSLTAFYFDSVIGSLTVILLFLLSYLLFRNEKTALWSAMFIALMPTHVLWATSAETNIASVFFVLLALLVFLIFLATKSRMLFAFSFLTTLLAILFRLENALLLAGIIFAYLYLGAFENGRNREYAAILRRWIVFAAILLIILVEDYFVMIVYPRAHLLGFYFLNTLNFIQVMSFGFLLALIVLLGAFFWDGRDQKTLEFLVAFFIMLFIVYLPIFTQTRMALMPSAILIILSAYSFEKINSRLARLCRFGPVLLIALLLLFFGFGLWKEYNNIFMDRNINILETKAVRELSLLIPSKCYVISEAPSILNSLSKFKNIGSSTVLRNSSMVEAMQQNSGCVYFFYDLFCMPILRPIYDANLRCNKLLLTFNNREVWHLSSGNATIRLFIIGTDQSPGIPQ